MEIKSNFSEPSMNGTSDGTKHVAPSASKSASGALAGASNEFHSLASDVGDLVKATTSHTVDDLAQVKTRLGARVIAAKKSVEEMSAVITGRARNTVTATNGYVHDQPWQAIGIAAALGVLIGFVLARR